MTETTPARFQGRLDIAVKTLVLIPPKYWLVRSYGTFSAGHNCFDLTEFDPPDEDISNASTMGH